MFGKGGDSWEAGSRGRLGCIMRAPSDRSGEAGEDTDLPGLPLDPPMHP